MNIHLFARSYADAFSVAAEGLAGKAPARRIETRHGETLEALVAVKKIAVAGEALDARW